MRVEVQLKSYAELIDGRMQALLPPVEEDPSPLFEAMRYAALGPGKRLRPALCLAACVASGGGIDAALNPACSLEMVHAFSLVHDDLPAIDNDDLRRGRPTLHRAFGDAVAILAGDALFAHAFQMLVAPNVGVVPEPATSARLVAELSRAVGVEGVVAGETADILAEGQDVGLATLESIHVRKTGILISASARMGAIAGGAAE
ncbi:polyprenyl synthetase family protein, partial [bacterium]